MPSITHASAALRIRSVNNRSVCSINGVNPNMSAQAAAGFVKAIQKMYNRGPVSARIHAVSEIELDDDDDG